MRRPNLLASALIAAACTGSAPPPATSHPAAGPSATAVAREPATLPELAWEREVVDGLRREGVHVTLIGASKFEGLLGAKFPTRVFIVRPGSEGADVFHLDRPIAALAACQVRREDGFWSTTLTVGDRVVSRGQGSQRALYSASDRYVVQAFGDAFDAAIRRALGTTRQPCGPVASQDLVRDVPGCTRTAARDTTGVITSDGRHGIVGDTYASSTAIHDAFTLVRRGAAVSDKVAVEFRQIGASAPASAVWYDVTAVPRPTAWGSAAFTLGVKPIGFANSCWRLIVDGADTGIVLAVGG